MDADERQIVDYLKSWTHSYVSAKEIARRAGGKRRFHNEPQWAFPVLSRLLEKGLIESDGLGHYRSVQASAEKKKRRWISPQMRRLLERSGKDFGETLDLPEDGGGS